MPPGRGDDMSTPTSLPEAIRQLGECVSKLNSLRMANVYGNMPAWVISDSEVELNELRAVLRIVVSASPDNFLPFIMQTFTDGTGKEYGEYIKSRS